MKISNISSYDSQGLKHRAKVVVFLSNGLSSRPGMKNILEDFEWRRNHTEPIPPEDILQFLMPTLIEKGITPNRIEYNNYAGCGMCPCSPGYCIYGKGVTTRNRLAIWLEDGDENEIGKG